MVHRLSPVLLSFLSFLDSCSYFSGGSDRHHLQTSDRDDFRPVRAVPGHPKGHLANGRFKNITTMRGSNHDEMSGIIQCPVPFKCSRHDSVCDNVCFERTTTRVCFQTPTAQACVFSPPTTQVCFCSDPDDTSVCFQIQTTQV